MRRHQAGPPPPTIMRPSAVSVRFGVRLRAALQFGPDAVDELIRTYDAALADHHRGVTRLATAIGRELGLSPDAVTGIALASSIHDIGEIGAPEPASVDSAPVGCDPAHSSAGASIVDEVHFPWPIGTMILQHHEHTDGSGFPHGLRLDDILFVSRVITVADAATTASEGGAAPGAAGCHLLDGRGSTYDASVVDACVAILPRAPTSQGVVERLVS